MLSLDRDNGLTNRVDLGWSLGVVLGKGFD